MSQPKKFDRDAILTNPSLPEVYNKLVDLAQEFAVLGEIDTTRTLVSLLLPDTTSDWQRNQLRHFEPFFAATNQWPDEIPENERTKETSDKTAAKHGLETDDRDDTQDDERKLGEQLERVRNAKSSYDDGVRSAALADALSTAITLASNKTSDLDEIQNDSKVQEVLKLIAGNLHKRQTISYLAGRHELCKLLSTGAVARKVPVDKDRLDALGKDVIATFTEQLLLEVERNTKANSMSLWEEKGKPVPETLFVLPPATDEQILALEKRLHVTLPDDYKEFLKITNGFGGTWNGFHLDPLLCGVDDVRWTDPGLETPYLEFHESISGTVELNLPDGRVWPDSGPTVEIGSEDVLSNLLAMDGWDTPENAKKQALRVIESRYGSFEKMQKLEWAAIERHDSDTLPCGTFRQFLEQRLRRSANGPYPDEIGKRREVFLIAT
ncbi:hypothetical protein EDB81DRAFT_869740 [Dactylonectria macrodidyma]|uniref:Knr4/Smi1-like domain-containing protein n=1 Tax=Dactylonectria macrodidyma TaxID=307937 RepID=A0A9P9J187_9HYPO|nr:hypothetical protein EDB81DRAFT_869740 [Dactylonectria macrodidyma]